MFLMKCTKCKIYTLEEHCPSCKAKTSSAHPIKFSLEKEEKYGKYRRLVKAKI